MNPNLIEPLESRIAPAAVLNLIDVDGDLVTISTSLGSNADLAAAITKTEVSLGRFHIDKIDLTASVFAGTSLSVTLGVGDNPLQGDGLADVGMIDSTNHDLGSVTVSGDLGQIFAGDGNLGTPGVAGLTLGSYGGSIRDRLDLGAVSDPQTDWGLIRGDLPILKVARDLAVSGLVATGTIGTTTIGGDLTGVLKAGSLPAVTINGSIDGLDGWGLIDADSAGTIAVLGDLVGSDLFSHFVPTQGTGSIAIRGPVTKIAIGGSLTPGAAPNGANIILYSEAVDDPHTSSLGTLLIAGAVGADGASDQTGMISIDGDLTSATIGSIVHQFTADPESGGFGAGIVDVTGNVGTLTIKGSVIGGDVAPAGAIHIAGDATKLAIAGSLSSNISCDGSIATILIAGSIRGGSLDVIGTVTGLTVKGSIRASADAQSYVHFGSLSGANIAGSLTDSGFFVDGDVSGAIKIGHDVTVNSIQNKTDPIETSDQGISVGGTLPSLRIGGSVRTDLGDGDFLDNDYTLAIGAGTLGAVSIGGDFEYRTQVYSGGDIRSINVQDLRGYVEADGKLGSATINGDLGEENGPAVFGFATLDAQGGTGSVRVAGSALCATIFGGGSETIGSIQVAGDFIDSQVTAVGTVTKLAIGGTLGNCDIEVSGRLGSLSVGRISGSENTTGVETSSALISVEGIGLDAAALTVGSIKVAGSVSDVRIAVGTFVDDGFGNQIATTSHVGQVSIGGRISATHLEVLAQPIYNLGDEIDVQVDAGGRIDSIAIAGRVIGPDGVIAASSIGSVKVRGSSIAVPIADAVDLGGGFLLRTA